MVLWIWYSNRPLVQSHQGTPPGVSPRFLKTVEIINNGLNEVCNGIHLEGGFDTRMGCSVEKGRALLAKIHAICLNT